MSASLWCFFRSGPGPRAAGVVVFFLALLKVGAFTRGKGGCL